MGMHIQNIAVSQPVPPALPFASAAAAYADLGWSVIPVARQSKKPLVKWKLFQQTPPNTALLEDWRQHYASANIAVVTGRVSNLLVIDIDDEQAVPLLEQAAGIADILELPVPTVKTGRGWHLYFQYPDAHIIRNATGIVPHVDVRGESGYVILPPSVHNSGHLYQWQAGKSIWDIPPPPLDAAWLRLLMPTPGTSKKKGSIEAILNDLRQAQNGHRNDALNKAAFALGRYVSKGKVSAQEAEDILRQQAQQLGLPDAEATATLHSGLMEENPTARGNAARAQNPALLRGLIRCGGCDSGMTPTHTRRHGRQYRYYTPNAKIKKACNNCPVGNVPAGEVEEIVMAQVGAVLATPEMIVKTWRATQREDASITEAEAADALRSLHQLWNELFPAEQARILHLLVEGVVISPQGVEVRLRTDGLTTLTAELTSATTREAA